MEAERVSSVELAGRMFPALTRGGPHAWGWMAGEVGDRAVKVKMDKVQGRADTAAAARRRLALLPRRVAWVVGHTRLATHGSAAQSVNNHPIRWGDILGVHNGVIRNYEPVLAAAGGRWGGDAAGAEVDSEAIFAAVGRWGWQDGLAQLDGSMAAAWVDLRDPWVVWLARGRYSPLVVARTVSGGTLWASQEDALRRSGLDLLRVRRVVSEAVCTQLEAGRPVIRWRSVASGEPVIREPQPEFVNFGEVGEIEDWTGDDVERFLNELDAQRATRRGWKLYGGGRVGLGEQWRWR